ncbi:MAG: hypothetical protein HQ581_12285 [Planctomycetes bacterium]|nr:hypothetical protein [Planctomycetota bacterium]
MKSGVFRAGTVSSPYVCALEQATDERSVGGKAWNLSRMLSLGVPVPPGIVVTDWSFQTFLDDNRLRGPIAEICDSVDPSDLETLKRAAASIRALVQGAVVPEEALEAVEACRHHLGDGQLLIVRSSAVGEDSSSASFAGQLDSFRDVRSREDLQIAIVGCWASCWSERALYYQHSRGVRIERMGVVIQDQVRSKVAGVLFSVSPEPSGKAEMLGEFCPGHGEDLVSGRINPGRFSISRENAAYRFLAHPEQPDREGTSHDLLDGGKIRALHRIGLMLEREFRGVQDIEWTIDENDLIQIVQTRPVTVPEKRTEPAGKPPVDAGVPLVVWSNANINENYPDPVSPFLYSVAADGYYHYFRNLARAFGIAKSRIAAMDHLLRNTIGSHGARLYYNLTNIHTALRMAPFGSHLVESFNIFVGTKGHAAPAPQAESFSGASRSRFMQWGELIWIVTKTAWQFLFLQKRVSAFERTVDEYAEQTHPAAPQQRSMVELHWALRSFLDIRCHRWTNASLADAASMIGYGLLKRLIGRAFPEHEHSALHNRLLQGLPDMVSAQPVIELWKLSRLVRSDPALAQLLADCEGSELWEKLRGDERFAVFLKEFESFVENWGFRCSGELMMTVKSFQEDPRGVFPLLRNYVSLHGESPVDMLRRQAEERRLETDRVYRALGRRKAFRFLPWPNMRSIAGIILRWTQRAIALRERARLKQSLLYSRCRRVVVRIGEKLVERGFLERPEDVFFLTHQELDSLTSGGSMDPHTVTSLVELRRIEHLRLGEMTLPDTMTLPEGAYSSPSQEAERQERRGTEDDSDAMSGIGVCGGRVTARATVLTDVSESGRLTAGDILVTRQTDPGWAPVFFVVKGLIMERGGMLSHGAIIAREYGIPTVVGVHGATRRIESGQTVSLDGDTGRVELVG